MFPGYLTLHSNCNKIFLAKNDAKKIKCINNASTNNSKNGKVPAAEKFVKYINVFKAWENKDIFVFSLPRTKKVPGLF